MQGQQQQQHLLGSGIGRQAGHARPLVTTGQGWVVKEQALAAATHPCLLCQQVSQVSHKTALHYIAQRACRYAYELPGMLLDT